MNMYLAQITESVSAGYYGDETKEQVTYRLVQAETIKDAYAKARNAYPYASDVSITDMLV